MDKLNAEYIFFYTGNPGPGMIDLIRQAQRKKIRTRILLLDRKQTDLIPDFTEVEALLERLIVPYSGVDIRRITSIPHVFNRLRKMVGLHGRPVVVNVHTLDTLFIALIVKIFSRCKIHLIYQVRDLHYLQIAKSLKGWSVQLLELFLIQFVEKILVSSPGFKQFYMKKYRYSKEIVLVENIPMRGVLVPNLQKDRKREGLVVGYIGIIRYVKSLNALINSLARCSELMRNRLSLFIAGGGDQCELVQLFPKNLTVCFTGAFEYKKEIQSLYESIDIVFAVYDVNDFNCRVAMPNKFYEALIMKKPIIVAKGTYLSIRVIEMGVGIAVDIDTDDLYHAFNALALSDNWYVQAKIELEKIDFSGIHSTYERQLDNSLI